MPAPRKSCERCKKQKARCIWTTDSTACVKCRRSGHLCSAPRKTAAGFDATHSDNGAPGTATEQTPPRTSLDLDGLLGIERSLSTGGRTCDVPPDEATELAVENPALPAQPSTTSPQTTFYGSSLIIVPALKSTSFPKLPSQLPLVEDTCRTDNCYLPPAEDAHVLLQEYLHDYNSKIPLFAPQSLYDLFRDCYAGAANNRPLAWVLVYTTVGMTYRLRAMSVFATADDTDQAEWYLDMCLGRLPDLLVQAPCIRLVQACISIAWLLETSPKCERGPFFASTALRLATQLGYNDLPVEPTTTVEDMEKRHVFWLAFFIDTHASFAGHRTSSLRLADINTPAPSTDVSNWWEPNTSAPGDQSSLNVFALHCGLAAIEAEAAEELFSVVARRRPTDDLRAAARGMLDKLSVWRRGNVLSRLDVHDISRSMYRSDIVLCVVLEAAYFRTLHLLHASNVLNSFHERADVFSAAVLRSMMQVDTSPCRDEARRFLRLAILMPQGNLSTTWYALRPMTAAFCALLSPRNFDPTNPQVYRSIDLPLAKRVLDALNAAVEGRGEPAHNAVVALCSDLYAIAAKL